MFASADREWPEVLARVGHDIYHTPAYHTIPGFGRQGEAYAFCYREDERTFLWPYLLSPIQDGFNDVTSVYGYSGPVSTPGSAFIERAWAALLDHWKMQRVVSAFTRFHPLLGNQSLLSGLRDGSGTLAENGSRAAGSTVSIDLSRPSEEQVRSYQKVHRQEIRKVRAMGFTTEEDPDWRHADDFVALYGDTMARRNSRNDYLIDRDWVAMFRKTLGDHAHLFVTKWNGTVAAALIAIEYRPYLHAHLTGINREMMMHSPLKVLLDDIREWGTRRGLQAFHLGGGVGGKADSLFEFKRKFSSLTHEFHTGAWILDQNRYQDFEAEHRRHHQLQGVDIGDPEFFPIYRYQPS